MARERFEALMAAQAACGDSKGSGWCCWPGSLLH